MSTISDTWKLDDDDDSLELLKLSLLAQEEMSPISGTSKVDPKGLSAILAKLELLLIEPNKEGLGGGVLKKLRELLTAVL